MKYLFVFLLVGLMFSCGDASGDASGDVTKEKQADATVKIGDLEVMTEDLGEMSWEDAKKACADLGDGWRLPTDEELNILYENKAKIGGFASGYYWSSTEVDGFDAWGQVFDDGYQGYSDKTNVSGNVRSVRAF
ncbi:DUF1566 domain-containing protein [Crocinitomicaceae bacterium]|nr:DUF1566 domain-containing protein [Crocinitomicaceae bacterium]